MGTATTPMSKRSKVAALLIPAIALTVVGVLNVIVLIACDRLSHVWSHSMETVGFHSVPPADALHWLAMSSWMIVLATCAGACCLYQATKSKAQVNMMAWAAPAVILHVVILGITWTQFIHIGHLYGRQALSQSSVDSLVAQHHAVAVFNKGYCSAWCLSSDSRGRIDAQFAAGTCNGGLQQVYEEYPSLVFDIDTWCLDALQHGTFIDSPGSQSKHGTSPFDVLMGSSWDDLVESGWSDVPFLLQIFSLVMTVTSLFVTCIFLFEIFCGNCSRCGARHTRQRDTTIDDDDDDDVVDAAYAKETEKQASIAIA